MRLSLSFAPLGLAVFPFSHGLRRGLHSFAALRLGWSACPAGPESKSEFLAAWLKPCPDTNPAFCRTPVGLVLSDLAAGARVTGWSAMLGCLSMTAYLSPRWGLLFSRFPTACAVGCILSPLCGWGGPLALVGRESKWSWRHG
jgi:hypothetical protein